MATRKRTWPVVPGLLLLFVLPVDLQAYSSGIVGYSGNPATGGVTCNQCHSGGVPPQVTINGPVLVQPGTTHTYTLTISGGQERAGGLDVSVTGGALSVADVSTYLLGGEITHSNPKPVAPVTFEAVWSFNWTAPPAPGTFSIYGAGNSVNLQSGPNGDAATVEILDITVTGGSTPGEASGPNANPLLVTAFDPVSGNLSLGYDVGCDTTDDNIYFGPLDQVATSGWTGAVCSIGVSGAHAGFDPGPGSYFFVVVGNKDADEGSYGRILQGDGSQQERPPLAGNTCGQLQNLDSSCDQP